MAIGIIDKCRLSILIFVSVSALSGCAVHYVDEFGANHMWGFVHVVNREERKEGSTIANLHQVTAFGLYYISMEQQSSIGLGYEVDPKSKTIFF